MPKKIWQQVQKEILPCIVAWSDLVFFFDFRYPTMHSAHCPKNNLNLCIKPEPVTFGADATVCLQYIYTCTVREYTVYCTVASVPAVSDSAVMRRFRLFLGQCSSSMHIRNGSLYVSVCNIVLQSWARHNSFATTSFRRQNC